MVLYRYNMDVDLDEFIKRAHTPNLKNHGIRRLGPTNVPFNGIQYVQTFILDQATYIKDKQIKEIFLWQEGQPISLHLLRWASHCFPIEKAGIQDFTHMIAQPSIKTLKIGKQPEAHLIET